MPQKLTYKRVLVAVDGSDVSLRAVDHAARIAKDEDATLLALHVVASPQFEVSLPEYYENARRSARKWIKDVENAAASHGMTIKVEILIGAYSIVDAIIGYAENQGVDLIVTGTRGRTQSVKLRIGSVATGLVEYASCSVLVVR